MTGIPTWIDAVVWLVVGSFWARIGWSLGGLVMRSWGAGEPHTTVISHGVGRVEMEQSLLRVEQPK